MARKPTLSQRIEYLQELQELTEGRIDDSLSTEIAALTGRASNRLALSDGKTVVALGGATGSGKSSLFNAISATNLAHPGVRRPTTSTALAATWGSDATELLDWLNIPLRHRITSGDSKFDNLVLIDLPDHDSTEAAHRAEVDRLVECVDVMIWVVDPQKYADAALHEGYLRPMASHAEVMLCVLNKADTLSEADREHCLADLKRLLTDAGLAKAKILATSTTTDLGIRQLREELANIVKAKTAAATRLTADLNRVTPKIAAAIGDATVQPPTRKQKDDLAQALGHAVGVPALMAAASKSVRIRGGVATGWPLVSWLGRFRRDPMRIHDRPIDHVDQVSGSMVSNSLRNLASTSSNGMPSGWASAVEYAARSEESTLHYRLDEAVKGVRLTVPDHRWWWTIVRFLQWLLIASVVGGLGWLGLNFALLYFQLPPVWTFPILLWGDLEVPLPTLLVFGGLAGGVILGILAKLLVGFGASSVARRVRKELNRQIAFVAEQAVLAPVTNELARYRKSQEKLALLRR